MAESPPPSPSLPRRFDLTRPVHWPSLGLDFAICVGVWVVGVLVQGARPSTAGLVASFATAVALTVVSWTLVKFDVPRTSRATGAGQPDG